MNPIPVADIKPFPCIQPGSVTVVVNQGEAGDGTLDNAAVNAAIAENPEASKEALGLEIGTPIGELTATWDDGAAVFTGIGLHVENLASSPYSALLNLGTKDGEDKTPLLRLLASNRLELFKSWTDETNYSRAVMRWHPDGYFLLDLENAGTGAAQDLMIRARGDKYLYLGAGGLTANGGVFNCNTHLNLGGALSLAGFATEFTDIDEPGSPSAGKAYLYFDNGKFKFKLPNGTVETITSA